MVDRELGGFNPLLPHAVGLSPFLLNQFLLPTKFSLPHIEGEFLTCGVWDRSGARIFGRRGLNLPTRGLKYGFHGIVVAKYLREK